MQIAKPIKKLKSQNYKLLKHENLIFKFPTKTKNFAFTSNHMQLKMTRLKKQSYVQNLALITV